MADITDKRMTLHFILERETKGSLRYQETDEAGVPRPYGTYHIGTLYVRKSCFTSTPPKTLFLTVEYAE